MKTNEIAESQRATQLTVFHENEKRLRTYALLHEITQIDVSFSGGGDSGGIDYVDVKSAIHPDTKTLELKVKNGPDIVFEHGDQPGWVHSEPAQPESIVLLHAFLQRHVEQAIDLFAEDIDWHNNEGGFGNWTWDPQGGLDFSVNINITESIEEFGFRGELGEITEDERI